MTDHRPPTSRGGLLLLGTLFVCSGANGLLVEQIFEKLLTTVVGSAVESGSIVLAVFFAGLFLGGVFYGAMARRVSNPFYMYALLESAVGGAGLLLSLAFSPIQTLSTQIVHLAGQSQPAILLARVLIACAWMLPPTIAMGATYPCVVRMVSALSPAHLGRAMSIFYALNLLGAVASAALCPYILFPQFGLGNVLRGAGGIQCFVALSAYAMGRNLASAWRDAGGENGASPSLLSNAEYLASGLLRTGTFRLLLIASLFSGFVTFAMEVLWFHLIGVTLGMSAYAFGLMLAVVLLGLFVGSVLVSLVPAGGALSRWLLPLSLAISALFLALSLRYWDDVPRWLLECRSGFSDFACGGAITSFWAGERLRLRIALLLIGLPAIPLGMVYPSLLRAPYYPADEADHAAGLLGAANAIGSITGALIGTFVLIRYLGSERTGQWLATAPALLACVACAALARSGAGEAGDAPRTRPIALPAIGALTVAALLAPWVAFTPWDRLMLTAGAHVYFQRHHVMPESKLEFWHEDTTGGIVTVVSRPFGTRILKTLLTNGKFQGNDGGEIAAQISIALIPCIATARRDRALVIGFGTGQSAEVVRAAGFGHVDVAEIAPGIIEAARTEFASVHRGVLDMPNVSLVLEDGRNHLVRATTPYDLISIELSSVWFAGVNNIYSREFYDLAASRMAEHGILQQWIQFHHLNLEEVGSVLATVRAKFRYVELWFVGGQGIIIASAHPFTIDRARFDELAKQSTLAPDLNLLAEYTDFSRNSVESRRLLDADETELVSAWIKEHGIPLNTDENRYLEYSTPRHALDHMATAERLARTIVDLLPPEKRAARYAALGLH